MNERPISDERLAEVRRDLAKASVPEQLALYPAGVMLSLIARLDVAEAAAAQRIRELEAALAAKGEVTVTIFPGGGGGTPSDPRHVTSQTAPSSTAPETRKAAATPKDDGGK